MIDVHKTPKESADNLISGVTFWDLYPVDLSSVEDVSVQSLPVSVRVTNLLGIFRLKPFKRLINRLLS